VFLFDSLKVIQKVLHLGVALFFDDVLFCVVGSLNGKDFSGVSLS
jgi:hypothetical protein